MKQWLINPAFWFFLILPFGATGQYFLTGTDGGSVRWNQYDGANIRLIFPENDSARAADYYRALNRAFPLVTGSIKGSVGSLDVVLHSYSGRSNGLTVWAPSRLEIFPVPPDDSYAQPWPDQLALHELRHVSQLTALNQGLTGSLAAVFGEHVTGVLFGVHLPKWFIEGDAVYSETVFSRAGRGRDPLFRMVSRAWASDSGKKSYNQLLFGSYRRFSPGAYHFGYEMVTRARSLAGINVWDSTLKFVAHRPFIPSALSAGLKQQINLSTVGLFDLTLDGLKTQGNFSDEAFPKTSDYVDFVRPKFVRGRSVVSVRERFGERPDIVIFDTAGAGPVVLVRPGSINPASFDARGQWLVWTEAEPHLRWEHRESSVVWLYHLNHKKAFRMARSTNWYSPVLSPEASQLAVVAIDPVGKEALLVLSVPDGQPIARIEAEQGEHLMTPVWSTDTTLLVLRLGNDGKALIRIGLPDGKRELVHDFGFQFVQAPAVVAGIPVVTTEWQGTAVLAAVTDTGLIVAGAGGYGVHYASGDNSVRWLCSVYTPAGYRVRVMNGFGQGLPIVDPAPWATEDLFAQREMGMMVDSASYHHQLPPSTAYRRLPHLFRFHSWAPAAFDVASREVQPGITFLSQNSLGTAVGSLGYRYLNELGNHQLFGTFDYYGFFPVFGFEGTVARRQTQYLTDEGSITLNWRETTGSLRSYLPLVWSEGRHTFGFIPQVSLKGEWYDMDQDSPYRFNHDTYLSINYSVQFYHTVKSSINDLFPRWGQVVYGLFRNSPFGGARVGVMGAGEGVFYFPGVLAHHGIRLYTGFEYQESGENYYGYTVDFPRGTSSFRLPHRGAAGITYAFPLLRPDWSLGKAAYVQRLTAKLFYDTNLGYTDHLNHFVSSAGVELNMDWHLLRLITPLNSGVRFSWIPDRNSVTVEMLFSVNFDSF